jgi:hypothetical protein
VDLQISNEIHIEGSVCAFLNVEVVYKQGTIELDEVERERGLAFSYFAPLNKDELGKWRG